MEVGRTAANETEDQTALQQEYIQQLCMSKAEEFRMLGYENITERDIWAHLSEQYEKKGYPRMHRIVNDILSLKVTQLMNWMTIGAFKGDMKF